MKNNRNSKPAVQLGDENTIKFLKTLHRPLLAWYDSAARDLPWRHTTDPYRIWLSEIMLQQTRVETVIPYFERFLKEFPTVEALARGDEDKLVKMWEGLGYYSRVRNIQKAAQVIVEEHGGKMPDTFENLLSLPGIGKYTAGAIGSIAFNLPMPAVDGNVYRVYARLLNCSLDISDTAVQEAFFHLAKALVPRKRPGDYNQAVMELGATICLPKAQPKCLLCPVNTVCEAYRQGTVIGLPYKPPKKARAIDDKTVFLLIHGDRVLLSKRQSQGLLAGMWEFPNLENHLLPAEAAAFWASQGMEIGDIQELGQAKHIFTHRKWHMVGYCLRIDNPIMEKDHQQWVTIEQVIREYALPSAFKVYRQILLELI